MTAWIVKSTLVMLVALCVVAGARRTRASVRHLVLAVLFLFLLALPVVQRFAPAIDIPVQPPVAAGAEVSQSPRIPPLVPDDPQPVVAETRPVDVVSLAIGGYAAGAMLLLLWLAGGVMRLFRMAANAKVWLDGTARMNEIALEANVRRVALVVLSREVVAPLTFGFRRSTIVLPEAARHWSADELARALRHELEHVRRDDWFLQLVARAACAIYWPHPLVWIAWRRFCLEAERACDDAVVGAGTAEEYATQLVGLARTVRRVSFVPALSMASRSRLAVRIGAILDATQPRGPHGRLATMTAITVMLALLASLAPARIIEAAAERVSRGVDEAVSEGVSGGIDEAVGEGAREGVRAVLAEALVMAAESGDLQEVRGLLDSGVSVNAISDGDGTALIGAARGGQMHMVEYLLERGADPNVTVPGDGSPLIAAARMGYTEIMEVLLDHGAAIDAIVLGDENALMQAAWHGHEPAVRLLLARGAGVHAVAVEGTRVRTALGLATRGGHEEIARLLKAAGAKK